MVTAVGAVLLTTWFTVKETLEAKLVVPLNVAVIGWLPTVSAVAAAPLVTQLGAAGLVSPTSVTVQSRVAPSVKVTLPTGGVLFAVLVTVAVKVTASGNVEGFKD